MCSISKCSVILCFFMKYLPHFWQCNALNVFSTWIITYIMLGVSHLWKKFQDEIVHQRTLTKKAPIFWLLVKDMKIPYIFYNIQNFQGTPWASIIASCLIKLLRTGPLHRIYSSFAYKVSKCHGLTVVRPRKVFMTLRKILRIVCANQKFMNFNNFFSFFLHNSDILCNFRCDFCPFFLRKISKLKFWPRKNLLLECL